MEAKHMDNYQGLKLEIGHKTSDRASDIEINGELSTFVKCGSQYAIWYQFPEIIMYTLKDLTTGKTFVSSDNELSISWDGNDIYDEYAEKPCNKIITEKISVSLNSIYFDDPPKTPIVNFELQAHYLNHSSDPLIIKNSKVILSGF